jgi:hypothetical protein
MSSQCALGPDGKLKDASLTQRCNRYYEVDDWTPFWDQQLCKMLVATHSTLQLIMDSNSDVTAGILQCNPIQLLSTNQLDCSI